MAGIKTADNQQWGLVSADGTSAPLPAGDGGEPLIDPQRRLYVIPLLDPPPFPLYPNRWQEPQNGGNETRQLLPNAGVLEEISGWVEGAAGVLLYVQIFDLNAAPGPADTPVYEIPVLGVGTYGWAPGRGYEFANGIMVALSSTPNLYTAGAGALLRSSATGWEG